MRSSWVALCGRVVLLLVGSAPLLMVGAWAAESRGAALRAEPVPARFISLADAEIYYRALQREQRDWPPLSGPLLRWGDQHPQVVEIRKRLRALGDLVVHSEPLQPYGLRSVASSSATEGAAEMRFDTELEWAVRRFQARHGLKEDGVVGPQTRRALNVAPGLRLHQLRLNQQRQAQVAAQMVGRYIHINLPAYELRLLEAGQVRLAMKTIIGRRDRPSPTLNSEIRSLVINPPWNVPRSIAFKDILPHLEEDPDYLASQNMLLVEGWSQPLTVLPVGALDSSRLYRGANMQRLHQPPGPGSALGLIKFDFPNPYSVYLHDTPARKLFAAERRAFSSGCIRLEEPHLLADLLVEGDDNLQTRLEEFRNQPATRHLRLTEPIPLFITYWTAWVDEEGVLQFRDDLYRLDWQHEGALVLKP